MDSKAGISEPLSLPWEKFLQCLGPPVLASPMPLPIPAPSKDEAGPSHPEKLSGTQVIHAVRQAFPEHI